MSVTGALIAGVGAASSIGGAAIASSGANNAANTQAQSADYAAQLQKQSADEALAFQREVYGTQQNQLAPYYSVGTSALSNLANLLGIEGPATGSTAVPTPGVPNGAAPSGTGSIPLDTNLPEYIAGPHGNQMLNPGRSNITANLPQGNAGTQPTPGPLNTLASLVNPNLGAPGSLSKGWDQTFQSPTLEQAEQQPGYKFQLETGLNAIQNSAAARGGALTQGTAQDLNNYAQGAAQTDYNNVYNQALQNYNTNFNTFQTNQANQYNRLAALAGVGQTATQQLGASGNTAAGNTANILLNSAGQIGNSIQNAGNARATGYLNAGNNYGNALNGIGGNLTNLFMLSKYLNQVPAADPGIGGA